ncbi:NINE protein [Pollutimonas harenae]|uniref:TM2 domain-containing protein n=1 Tax=Pollutimonas harenae TaxID=657015 RepID=A0A853GT55_9BURK|nr:NINE protein [Pollutimonas harenae]NYT85347.1 TM2 domain-containing protein [Pollutimonas harenae]TEA70449.1 TM2 domain-containing protein [Pollutimonas harenae]
MTQSTLAVPVRHRSKTAAAWLAFLLGVFGVHAWYVGRTWAWLWTSFTVLMLVLVQFYPVWWDNPPFLVLIVPCGAGFIEALIFALKPDEWFDKKYNTGSGRTTRTGWGPVIAAIATTFVGGTVLMFGLALIVMHVYTAMGWLDGYVY